MGYQNEHYTYLNELATKLYEDRDRPMILDNEDVVLEIVDEAIHQPEILIGEMIFFVYTNIYSSTTKYISMNCHLVPIISYPVHHPYFYY